MKQLLQFLQSIKGRNVALVTWLVVNLIQAAITPILDDEAYYWLWSTRLNWGYFDHPPFVALIIKIGSFLFKDEMGLRFLSPFLSAASLWMLLKLAQLISPKTRKAQAYIILAFFSTPILNVYGFFTTPDVPLLFWGSTYLLCFFMFLEKGNFKNAFILSVVLACIMYSKYHAALLILFSIAAYPKVLLKAWFWFASFFSLALFAPHLIWQHQNNYPSFGYHLVSRAKGFEIAQSAEFLAAQLAIFGPLLLLGLFINFKSNLRIPYRRTLLILSIAFPVFFLLSTLNGRAEAHWSALGTLPAICLVGINLAEINLNQTRKFTTLSLVLIGLFLAGRIVLVSNSKQILRDFSNDRNWARKIELNAEEKRVVFINSYRRAAKYSFYTGLLAHSENNYYFRKSQFDIWKYDTLLANKPAAIVAERQYQNFKEIDLFHQEPFYIGSVENYSPLQRLTSEIINAKTLEQSEAQIEIELNNPYPKSISINDHQLPISFYLGIRDKENNHLIKKFIISDKPISLPPGKLRMSGKYQFKKDLGGCEAELMIRHGDLPQIVISEKFRLP